MVLRSRVRPRGMAEADVSAIRPRRMLGAWDLLLPLPTKEHVLVELERREEDRIAKQFAQLEVQPRIVSALNEAVRLVVGLERRLGDRLF